MRLTSIEISNFRGIHHAITYFPQDTRIVCIIGSGDSGKSSLLKAIEWVLWPNWNLIATDTDFFNCDSDTPIVITASITEVPDALLTEDKFGLYLRDFKSTWLGLENDEPTDNGIVILTIRLTIDSTLEPKWEVITNRTDPKPISQKDRRLLSFGVVGYDHEKDFQWGRNSILQKYADSRGPLHSVYTQAMRNAVANTNLESLDAMAPKLAEIGCQYGVAFNGELHNKLLMQSNSFSASVGMFDDKVPFSQRGLGSKRLLSIGMNVSAYDSGTLVLVDEVETGLEPYRISALINQFRTQFKDHGQLIMTTHSRSVVCECNVNELVVANLFNGELSLHHLNMIDDIRDSIQAMIRSEPDGFLSKRIIVCEGKTEVGFLRAFDNYLAETELMRFAHFGVGIALGGGGDKFFTLAKLFKNCGYDVCVLMDSDIESEEKGKQEMAALGIPVFAWESGYAIEQQIFHDISNRVAEELIQYAAEEKSLEHVKNKLDAFFVGTVKPYTINDDKIKLNDTMTSEERTNIGKIAKQKRCEWFKRIDLGQQVGSTICANIAELDDASVLKRTLLALRNWVTGHEK